MQVIKIKTMDAKTALDLANKIEHYYNRKVRYSEGVQGALLDHLTPNQFKKFCESINQKKRNEMLPDALKKEFSVKVLENPVEIEFCINDAQVAENWTFGQIIQAVQTALQ